LGAFATADGVVTERDLGVAFLIGIKPGFIEWGRPSPVIYVEARAFVDLLVCNKKDVGAATPPIPQRKNRDMPR
jgi:hypothetical protein